MICWESKESSTFSLHISCQKQASATDVVSMNVTINLGGLKYGPVRQIWFDHGSWKINCFIQSTQIVMYHYHHIINYSSFQIIILLKTFIENHISLPIARSCFIEEDKHLITSPIWFKVCHTLKTLDLITSKSKVENTVAPASLILLFSQGLSEFVFKISLVMCFCWVIDDVWFFHINKNINYLVPENIHIPTTDGIGNSEGVGVKDPRNSGGKGGWMVNLVSKVLWFKYWSICSCLKILSHLLSWYLYLNLIIFKGNYFFPQKSTLEANKREERAVL